MPTLAAASNVAAPAYYALVERGYTVTYHQANDWWTAEKDGVELLAHDPIQLCGIAYIYELRGENWRVSDESIDAFLALEAPDCLPDESE